MRWINMSPSTAASCGCWWGRCWWGRDVGGVGPTQAIDLYKKEAKITLVLGLEAYF